LANDPPDTLRIPLHHDDPKVHGDDPFEKTLFGRQGLAPSMRAFPHVLRKESAKVLAAHQA
jgi:hypothetical protein